MESLTIPPSPEGTGTDAALRAAYQRLVHSSPDGFFAFDRALVCTVWNPGMARLTQIAEDDAVGRPVLDSLRALAYDDEASLIEVLLDNIVLLEDREYPRADGGTGYLAGHLSPLRDEANTIIGGFAVLRDITDSKRVSQALEERLRETLLLNRVIAAAASTLDLRSALESILAELAHALEAPQGAIALLDAQYDHLTIVADYHPPEHASALGAKIPVENNPTTQYILRHHAALAIPDVRADKRLGIVRALVSERGIASMLLLPLVVREQIIGTLGLDSYVPREFSPEDISLAEHVAAAVSQALDNAQLYSDLEMERAYLLLANDAGRALTAQVSMKGVIEAALALASRLGAMDSYVLVMEDGAPLFFESTAQAAQTWDEAERLEFAERLAKFGLERIALETRQAVILEDARTDPRWYQALEEEGALNVGAVIAVPFFGTRSTLCGVIAYVHQEPERFDTRTARVIELIGRYLATALENAHLFEQTRAALQERQRIENERLALERKMLEAQKLESLGVLAGGIAHDFNNLLVSMLGNAGLALMEVAPESRARQYVEQIQVAAQRAADLTRQMLAYSGRGRFIVQSLSLNDVIEEMVRLLRVSISKQATLQLNLAPNLPLIAADATQLRQVVMNLITNASDALNERAGTITVSTGAVLLEGTDIPHVQPAGALTPGEYVFLEVADSGSGMDAETAERIFEPFFTTKFTGRGLGLAAVLGIMRGHRGAIQVNSVVGEGTTFRLLFPPPKAGPTLAPSFTTGERLARQARILVVDDDAIVREIIAEMLTRFGYEIQTAENGARALELMQERGFDCLMLDLTMPGMSSEEILAQLRRISPTLRVILMSGYTEQDATARFGNVALDGFVQKPFTPYELLDRVQAALTRAANLPG
jgi:PAS domain S-box-containing protein